jgi:AmmeMemoRadiSam system protein A
MFWKYSPPDLTPERQQILLKLGRDTIKSYITDQEIPEFDSEDPQLNRLAGAFVTIKQDGELRGCIGHTRADTPLYQVIQEMAVAAATQDPRFPPLTGAELEEISIEISVLSPMQRIAELEDIEIGTDGLLLNHYGHQGIFLPQVPVEQGWGRQEYLSNLCLKAGVMTGCWKENPTIYKFSAIVFSDES